MSVSVLIVEDDPVTQRVLRQRLESIGCRVLGALDNAAGALASFRELHPDLITLDIEMPEVAGVDALAFFNLVRREDPNCEVIVISATAFPTYREKFVKAGVLGFFSKPLNFEKLATDAVAPTGFRDSHFGNLKLPRRHRQQSAATNCFTVQHGEEDPASAIQYDSAGIGQQFRFPGLYGKIAVDPFLIQPPKISLVPWPELAHCELCLWRCHYL